MMGSKNVLITGSTDGIGKQTAHDLSALGYNLIIHGRDEMRVKQTVAELKRNNNILKIEGFVCDLSSLSNVRKFADDVKQKYSCIDVLINNAGVYIKKRQLTVDGFEMTFAVNHLSHFLLTNLLLDLVKESPEGRIINVSSIANQNAELEWNNLNGEKYYEAYSAYALSKLANILFTKELSENLKGTKITTNSLHPGVISTKLLKAGFGITGASLKKGAETSVYLANSDEVKLANGEYFVDCKIAASHPITYDKDVCKKFWDTSAIMVGL